MYSDGNNNGVNEIPNDWCVPASDFQVCQELKREHYEQDYMIEVPAELGETYLLPGLGNQRYWCHRLRDCKVHGAIQPAADPSWMLE